MFLLHAIPIDESTTVPLGRELLYCAVRFWQLFLLRLILLRLIFIKINRQTNLNIQKLRNVA